jgi:hypothetical protein
MDQRSTTSPSPFRGRARRNRSSAVALVLLAACLAAVCSRAATASGRPAPPRSFQVRSVSKTSIHVSWSVSRSPVRVAGFRVYVNGALRASVRGTSYRVGGLSCGTTYVLAISAYDDRGHRSKLRSRRVSTTQCGERCFASPGSCGYPDPSYHNVGVPQGTTLKPSGDVTVARKGAVINGVSITNGSITVEANDVTIENSRIACNCGPHFAVYEPNGYSGLTIKDSEISGGNVYAGGGAGAINNFTRLYIWNCDECIQYDANITDSYLNSNAALRGAHYEPVYNGDGTTNIQHSVLLNPHEQTATVIDGGPGGACVTHLTVNNSLLAGGGYLIYPCANDSSAGSSATVITNNRFARCTTEPAVRAASGQICQGHGSTSGDGDVLGNPDNNGYYPRGGFFGVDAYIFCSQTTWKNNVWDDGGAVAC